MASPDRPARLIGSYSHFRDFERPDVYEKPDGSQYVLDDDGKQIEGVWVFRTEADWLRALDPEPMVDFLGQQLNRRKLRLFACACCRRGWDRLAMAPPDFRLAIETSEKFADGNAQVEELAAIFSRIEFQRGPGTPAPSGQLGIDIGDEPADPVEQLAWACRAFSLAVVTDYAEAAEAVSRPTDFGADAARAIILSVVEASANCVLESECGGGRQGFTSLEEMQDFKEIGWKQEKPVLANLLRDILGNPFRSRPTLDPAWLRWHDAIIPRLALQMYDSRDFTGMPILADALEEAGCTNADILDHCRSSGPHVLGCWVVDLILGKE